MPNNYNAIAGVYDFLSRLIFRRSIVNAQVFLLKLIPGNSNVLIVGGGTGWVLEKLDKLQLQNMHITYVEKSGEMIVLSKKRKLEKIKVEFIQQGIEEFSTEKKFDIVFTAFLFDNFLPEKIEFIFSKLDQLLNSDGLWLYADFRYDQNRSAWWQKFLLKAMYLFFKITCNIETQQLIDMSTYFSSGYFKVAEQFFYSDFIKATAFKKQS